MMRYLLAALLLAIALMGYSKTGFLTIYFLCILVTLSLWLVIVAISTPIQLSSLKRRGFLKGEIVLNNGKVEINFSNGSIKTVDHVKMKETTKYFVFIIREGKFSKLVLPFSKDKLQSYSKAGIFS